MPENRCIACQGSPCVCSARPTDTCEVEDLFSLKLRRLVGLRDPRAIRITQWHTFQNHSVISKLTDDEAQTVLHYLEYLAALVKHRQFISEAAIS